MKKIFYSLMVAVFAAFTFTSCEDVPMPYEQPGTGGGQSIVIEPTGSGTADDPFNITALNEYATSLNLEQDASDTKKIYFRGKVVSIKEITDATSFGNATFYLSDDGTTKNQFYVYRALGLNNAKVTSTDLIKEGDEVVVCGTIMNYKGTLETAQNQAYIVSVNGTGSSVTPDTTTEPKGAGTAADPYNVAAAIAKCKETGETATTDSYYVTGVAKTIDASGAAQYGNITIDMVDNGSNDIFKAFQILSINGAKFTEASVASTVKEGDVIVVKGNLVNYKNNTPETTGKGAAQLVSVNGKSGSDTPDTPDNATEITCAKAVEICNALEDKVETTELYTVTGYITDTDGKISRDQQVFWMADTKDGRKMFEAYWANIPDPTKALPVGTKVKMTGKLMRYGTTPEMKNGNVVVLEMGDGSSTGGNDNTGGNTGSSEGLSFNGTTVTMTAPGITAGTTTTTLDFSTLGYENAADVTTVNFPDGATLTFDKNTNKNAPKYYTATKGVRVYSDNILTFTGASNIAVITMECDVYNGVNQVGSKVATISFSGKTAVYTNVNDGANTQLRVKTITITYAN